MTAISQGELVAKPQSLEAIPAQKPLFGIEDRLEAWRKHDRSRLSEIEIRALDYIDNLFPHERNQLLSKRGLVLGSGNVGGNIAVALAQFGVGIVDVRDPDTIESRNIKSGQPYTENEIGESKAISLAARLNSIYDEYRAGSNFTGLGWASLSHRNNIPVTTGSTGTLDRNELALLCSGMKIDFIVDAIAVEEPAAVRSAHDIAKALRIPIFTGFDLMTGIKVISYDHRYHDIEPLEGAMNIDLIRRYEELRRRLSGNTPTEKIILANAAKAIQLWGMLNPMDVYPSIVKEELKPTAEAGKITQLPDTARTLGVITATEIARVLLNKREPFIGKSQNGVTKINYDLEREIIKSPTLYALQRALSAAAGYFVIRGLRNQFLSQLSTLHIL